MANIIAFHSYKGGTGKTTIACNCAAMLARKGYRVCLLDLDVYAPSLQSYFEKRPLKWINDFLYGDEDIQEIIMDFTNAINEDWNIGYGNSIPINDNSLKLLSPKTDFEILEKRELAHQMDEINVVEGRDDERGKLWICFCNNRKEDIQKLEAGTNETKKEMFKRLLLLRERLISKYSLDYILIDTSPGIRFWSLNALAIADIFLLTLKMGDLDVDGTRSMATEIYSTFAKYGSKSFLLCNRVAGYCMPRYDNDNDSDNHHDYNREINQQYLQSSSSVIERLRNENEGDFINTLANEIGMKVISTIPCYCDIQFAKKEFLTVLRYPEHPFAKQIQQFTKVLETTRGY